MTTYWCDPYLECTYQGNGTTDTTSKLGTYASPISLEDLMFSSDTQPVINGVGLSDGDIIKIKGLPFSTIMESTGNCYFNANNATMQAIASNTYNFASTTSRSPVYAFSSTIAQSTLGNWSDPIFFSTDYNTSNTNSRTSNANKPYFNALQKGFYNPAGQPSVGIEMFRVKDDYHHKFTYNSNPTYFGVTGTFARGILYSAGWTSETAQDGWSLFHVATTYRYSQFYYGSSQGCGTFDCKRLILCQVNYGSSSQGSDVFYINTYTRHSRWPNQGTNPRYTNQQFLAMNFGSGQHYVYGPETRAEFYLVGFYNTRNMYMYDSLDILSVPLNIGNQVIYFRNYHQSNNILSMGDTYNKAYVTGNKGGFYVDSEYNLDIRFLDNSVYYWEQNKSYGDLRLAFYTGANFLTTDYYGTNLSNPGNGKLSNWTDFNNNFLPSIATSTEGGVPFARFNKALTGNNWWDIVPTAKGAAFPITVISFGVLECNGNNPETTDSDLKVLNNVGGDFGISYPVTFEMVAFETNDYNNKPMLLLYYNDNSNNDRPVYGHLAFNETISNVDVLTVRKNTLSTNNTASLPIELQVPNYTQGVDNLRVILKTALSNTDTSNTQRSITFDVKIYYRDNTQSGNNRRVSFNSTQFDNLHTVTSPAISTIPLSVPSSGQEKITSVVLLLNITFSGLSFDQFAHLLDAYVETY